MITSLLPGSSTLHTAATFKQKYSYSTCPAYNTSARATVENTVSKRASIVACVSVATGTFTEPFPSSGRLFLLIKICCLAANVVLLLVSRSLPRRGAIRHNILQNDSTSSFGYTCRRHQRTHLGLQRESRKSRKSWVYNCLVTEIQNLVDNK
jgi:hypothetical protein